MINFTDISFKCQLLALAVVIILMADFFRNKKLPLRSTKVFGCFMFVDVLNLLADIASYYTLLNYRVVPAWLNRITHILFIGTIEMQSVCLFLYVFYLYGAQKRFSKKQIVLTTLPFVFAAIGSAIMPIEYIVDEHGAYSTGMMVFIMYGAIFTYIVLTIVFLCRKMDKHQHSDVIADFRQARRTILVGLCIWIAVALIQFTTKYLLISSMGTCLMLLVIYLNFENPKRYADDETATLNRQAFHIMVPEMLARKKTFWLVSLTVDDNEQITKSMGYDQMKIILKNIAEQLRCAIPKANFFHSRSSTISVFVTSKEQLDALLSRTENADFTIMHENIKFTPQYHILVMECPKYGSTPDEIYDTMDFILSTHHRHENGRVFTIDDSAITEKQYRKQVLSVLTKAVLERSFDVVYQPIWSAKDGRFASAEALVRLHDCGDLGFISPEIFIPMAEQQGYIAEIGGIVFEKVCSFAAKNRLWELGIKYIEVNLSGLQSVDPMLPVQLEEVMKKYGIKPAFINLEITETASVNGGDMLRRNMDSLRSMGCHFSMDDFGTGYSNLSQMASVRFELIKLDKSLIWPCFGENNGEPLIILNSCIDMILRLGVNIVAEGVETAEQAKMLINKGVNYLQGYYFSKPVGEDNFINRVKESATI